MRYYNNDHTNTEVRERLNRFLDDFYNPSMSKFSKDIPLNLPQLNNFRNGKTQLSNASLERITRFLDKQNEKVI